MSHPRTTPLPVRISRVPQQLFATLARQPGVFWLDSGPSHGHHARFHHLGAHPVEVLREADPVRLLRAAAPARALAAIPATTIMAPAATRPPAPRWVGALAYDAGRHLAPPTLRASLEALPADPVAAGEGVLARYDAVVTVDLLRDEAWISADSPAAADGLIQRLLDAAPPPAAAALSHLTVEPPEGLTRQILQVLEAIRRGDVYQVNLSRRFEARLTGHPADLYLRLRHRRPAPMGAYLDLDGVQVLSNSPEVLLRAHLGTGALATWPLKGTRPAGGADHELLQSPKDLAEHVMIVDLERNDLGRVATPGTVAVPGLHQVVRYPTVTHLESEIRATARAGVDLADVFAAVFPGGSITGAPKLAAMALIGACEQRRRGLYCGAVGYVDADGERSQWSIPIRTAVVSDHTLAFRSGGGIVSDSNPAHELAEMETKARAFLELCG